MSERLNEYTVVELKAGDKMVYVGKPDGRVAEGITLGKEYVVTEDYAPHEDVMLMLLGGFESIAKFVDDDGDDCMIHQRNCDAFARV